MTTTKLGRRVLGHKCSYECDCDDWVELPTLDSTHCEPEPVIIPLRPASGFCVGMIACCVFWCLVLLGVCKVWGWIGW